jgi:hypothetical protein
VREPHRQPAITVAPTNYSPQRIVPAQVSSERVPSGRRVTRRTPRLSSARRLSVAEVAADARGIESLLRPGRFADTARIPRRTVARSGRLPRH